MALPALAACGFAPVYGPDAPSRDLPGTLAVAEIPGSFGFVLRERLVTRLGGEGRARHLLEVSTDITSAERAIRGDNTITRFNLEAEADYAVRPADGGEALTSGRVLAFAGYSAVGSPFATRAAEADARDRLARSLADQIVLRLTATAGDWAS